MSFLEKNKKILLNQYPGLFEELCISNNDDFLPEDIKIEPTPAGEPTLCIKGFYVHSQRDPLRESQRLAESVSAEKGAVVILGFGLGYAAQASAIAAAKLGRPVIIVEKHKSLLLKAFELRDFTDFLSKNRIIFIVGGTGEGVTSALKIANDLLSDKKNEGRRPSVIRNKTLTGLDEQWYRAVDDRIRAWTMKDEVNQATHKRFGQRWVRNLSRNMSEIRDCPGVSRLAGLASAEGGKILAQRRGGTAAEKNEFPDTPLPVFLAAAGPSLDKIKPLLRDIYDRCIIVAVDTSLRFFVQNGVQPDFVVVMDPQFWNSRHLDRCVCEGLQTALIAESAVYPPVLSLPFKNKFLCGSMFPLSAFIENQVDPKGRLGAGGSVATTAWDFARTLGCNEIWITGLDLAFPGLKTHFRGARFEALSNSQSSRFSPAEKWIVQALRDGVPFKARSAAGTQILTDKRLSLYASWFENQFRPRNSVCTQVQNFCLFQEGLDIAGLHSADTENFLTLPKRREEIALRIQEAFLQIEAVFNEPKEKRKRADVYENTVSDLNRGLENLKADAVKGIEIAQQALKNSLSLSEQDKVFKALDAITQRLTESKVKEIADFLIPQTQPVRKNDNNPFNVYLKSSLESFLEITQSVDSYLLYMKN